MSTCTRSAASGPGSRASEEVQRKRVEMAGGGMEDRLVFVDFYAGNGWFL